MLKCATHAAAMNRTSSLEQLRPIKLCIFSVTFPVSAFTRISPILGVRLSAGTNSSR